MGNRRHFIGRVALVILFLVLLQTGVREVVGGARDEPFQQAISRKFALPEGLANKAHEVCVDRDGIVYVRTDSGVARLFGDRVALDQSYRPLQGKIATDVTVVNGKLYYLLADEVLSNRDAGKFVRKLSGSFQHVAVNSKGEVLLARDRSVSTLREGRIQVVGEVPGTIRELISFADGFYVITSTAVYRGETLREIAKAEGLNTITFHKGELVLGTANGFRMIDPETGRETMPLQQKLPSVNITALASDGENLWGGTTQGVWRRDGSGSFRYFASKRWLEDDGVIDLSIDPQGNVYALTKSGLNKIEFRKMTLSEKASWYDEKIRQRHIRYGFCAELRMKTPGDPTTAEMIDTDNDGTWSNYYMASQAFRFGATGEEQAARNAWETFEALERLEEINPLEGFPSRTFERAGFKVSDVDRWYAVGDGIWDWKAHTSSDEIAAHMFGCAVLYETTAKTSAEKKRIAAFVSKVADHIIQNGWQLIDKDGKPTLWGRWNPEYLNNYPKTIFDRRLNSAEITALLQFAYAITGKEVYKEKAYELFEKHGYLENILAPMTEVTFTPGYKHMGITLGMDWNHSDDLLAFITYWVLHRHAFDDELRRKFAGAIRDHWELERNERNPLWSFVYASTGASDHGLEDALWTLRHFPLDMVDWSVRNSHRQDLTRLEPNFREQQMKELLPPDERRMTRWNSQPFILDGGSDGRLEYGGDEFLLPYWMGRYLKLIE